MLTGFLGGLANAGTIAQGQQDWQRRNAEYQLALQQLAAAQRREQALGGLARAARDQQIMQLLGGTPQTGQPGAVAGPGQPTNLLPPSYPTPGVTPDQMNFTRLAMAQGYPAAAAAGMAGSLTRESGPNLNPAARNAASGNVGIAQWGGPRKAALLAQPNPMSRQTQEAQLFRELGGLEQKVGWQMRGETDPRQAAADFTTGFERPSAREAASSMPARTQAAEAIYNQLSPEERSQARSGAVNTAAMMPPQMAGRVSLPQLAQIIDRTSPGASDEVKGMILSELYQLLSKDAQLQFQQAFETYKFESGLTEKQREFDIREEELKAQHEFTRMLGEQRLEGQGWQFLQTPDGIVRASPRTGEVEPVAGLPKGTSKIGSGGGGLVSASEVQYWANVLKQGGSMPAGASRNKELVTQVMAAVGQSGMDPGQFLANQAMRKTNQSVLTSMERMSNASEAFEQTAIRNFDLALKLSKDAIPTDWGPWVNAFVETGETQAGNADVPPYVAAMLTAANEYAKIMSGATGAQGSTVDSRREAAQLFSPYLNAGQIDRVVAVAKTDMKNRLQSNRDQVASIKKKLGDRGSEAPPSGEGKSYPVPPEYADDPDGTTYDEGKYVKRGDRIVPTGK